MKIITGKLKGKEIKNPNIDGTRPTMDRVKESIFSSIQNYVNESICLDLFAGTGNLGIEAISEGATFCYFIDNNEIIINNLKKTVKNFHVDNQCKIVKKDYKNFIKKTDVKFDIIFLDPPYDLKVINSILKIIKERNILNNNGIIVCEYQDYDVNKNDFIVLKEKKYGDKMVTILKKEC